MGARIDRFSSTKASSRTERTGRLLRGITRGRWNGRSDCGSRFSSNIGESTFASRGRNLPGDVKLNRKGGAVWKLWSPVEDISRGCGLKADEMRYMFHAIHLITAVLYTEHAHRYRYRKPWQA